MIWNITFMDCCLENCFCIWLVKIWSMVVAVLLVILVSLFLIGIMPFLRIILKNYCNFFYIFHDQERWGWNHLQHEITCLNLLSVKMFSNGSIWPLGYLCKTLKIVFFFFLKRISIDIGSTSSECLLKPFRVLNSTDWWSYSETPPSFFAFRLDGYLYSF